MLDLDGFVSEGMVNQPLKGNTSAEYAKCHNLLLGLEHPGYSTLITWLLSVWRVRCVLQMSNDATLCDRAGVYCSFHRRSEHSVGIKIAYWSRVA